MSEFSCVGLTSEILLSNLETLESLIYYRLMDHWIDKERFKPDTFYLEGVAGLGSEEGHKVVVNYNINCVAVDGMHRFVFFTNEATLASGVEGLLVAGNDAAYVPEESGDSQKDLSSGSPDDEWAPSGQLTVYDPSFIEEFETQPIDIIDEWELNYALGSCVENIAKYHVSGEPEFLAKAIYFLIRENEKFANC